jgi:hypothetical protein
METAISKINEFNLSKEQIKNFIEKATNEALNGNYDILEVRKNIKILEDVAKGIKQAIEPTVLDEAAKHGKTFNYCGVQFQTSIRNTYDYKSCNDDKYNTLKTDLKARENFLKSMTEPVADTDTGEIINPPTYKSTESIKIKL